MKIEVLDDADAVAEEARAIIATDARIAVAARGRFTLAVSGGSTPWVMLRALADIEVPWAGMHVVQVDERVAPRAARSSPNSEVPPRSRPACPRSCWSAAPTCVRARNS